MALKPGSVFAGFQIERLLGAGGMGAVYAARHPRLPRLVALKILAEGLGTKPEFLARFEREGELAARLDHPNVVAVYDRGIEDGQPWIAMQYVDGVDADELLRRGQMTPERAVYIIREAAKGLDHAHRHRMLHRDVKPANIMIAEEADDDDKVLVGDFGIARALDQTALTSAGSGPATLLFASPEQLQGGTLDHRSDIYSLGCTLYVLLTGLRPFPRESMISVMQAHLTEPPPKPTLQKPGLPAAMDEVIAQAMAKNPADRYASCRQLANAAAAALAAVPPPTQSAWGKMSLPPVPTGPTVIRQESDSSARPMPPQGSDSLARPMPPQDSQDTQTPTAVGRPSSDPQAPTISPPYPPNPPGTGGGAVDTAQTILPDGRSRSGSGSFGPDQPEKPARPKRGLLIAAGVGAFLLVAGGIAGFVVLGGDKESATTAATTTSPTVATVTAAPPAGGWQAYDFVAKAFPALLPKDPADRNYLGGTCTPINPDGEPIDDFGKETAIARINCTSAAGDQGDLFRIQCNRDRTPWMSLRGVDDLPDVQNEAWTRETSSGRVVYATNLEPTSYGVVGVAFDAPAQNFCQVWAFGADGSTGQQVYDGWFQKAPF